MPPSSRRWRVLTGFVLAALVTQLFWLNFAPMLVELEGQYSVSELTASLLVLPFPLLYVVLSIPSGALVDRYGYRRVVGAGAVVTALGSLIRLDTGRFASLVAGQVVIAVAQPFVVNGISKLVADWFEPEEAAIATGLGTVGMFVGMALGMAATPPLVGALTLRGAMAVNAAFGALVAVLWFVLCEERGVAEAESPSPWGELLANRRLWLLLALALLGLGYFNGLTTWLEQLVASRGMDADQAGVIGGVIVLGGIVGAVAVPTAADHYRVRRWPLLACAAAATACNAWMAVAPSYGALLASGALLGFFFLPAFALLLTMTGEVVPARDNGAATGLLMLAGNGGGVLVILALPALGDWAGPGPWGGLVALTLVTLLLAAFAPETFPRPAAAPQAT